jgi:hypothetical protein
LFHRLAFAEKTRRPVEEHMKRPTPYFFMDLVALDAIEAAEAHARRKAEQDSKRGRG